MASTARQSEFAKIALALAGAIFVVFYVLSVPGCDFGKKDVLKETDESHFIRGQNELRRGNYEEAMNAFLKVAEKRRDAPESHFELGRIYLEKMNDPVEAIHHFRKYLELKPDTKASPMVRQMIGTAQIKLAASIPESPFENNARRIELEDLLRKLQNENLELKKKLDAAVQRADKLQQMQSVSVERTPEPPRIGYATHQTLSESGSAVRAAPRPAKIEVKKDIPSTYTVQAGDTLTNISRKIYGTVNRRKDIFKANSDKLATPDALRPGQILRLPK